MTDEEIDEMVDSIIQAYSIPIKQTVLGLDNTRQIVRNFILAMTEDG